MIGGSEDEHSSDADLGIPSDRAGLDLRRVLFSHGGLEGGCDWGPGRQRYGPCGLVLVQSVEVLHYRL